MRAIAMKICNNPDCQHEGVWQSDENFAIDQSREDGLALICSDCNKARCKRWYKENKERKKRLALEYKAQHGRTLTHTVNRRDREKVLQAEKKAEEPGDFQLIRFSESEWLFILQQAQAAGITPEQFAHACIRDARIAEKRKV